MTAADVARAAPTAVIEGSLREVALADVLQLLDLGRKTGLLRVHDALRREHAGVVLVGGRLCGAALAVDATDHATLAARALAADAATVCDIVVGLLAWPSGRFAVVALPDGAAVPRGAGLGVDAVLMEAARRADEWEALADRVPNADVVPALAYQASAAGPSLALEPGEWALLAWIDGALDLRALAERTGGDVLAVARAVHRLVGEGLVVVDVPDDGRRSSEE